MDLNVSNYSVIELFGIEIWITETIVNTWIVMGVLIVLAIVVRLLMAKADVIPKGFQNVVEMLVEMFDNFITNTVGSTLNFIAPWFFTVAAFLVTSALISILGFRAPTADWTTTFALSVCTFVLMVLLGLKYSGPKAYFQSLLVPAWPFLPVNIFGEIAKPISLSFRLFGNMLSGTIIIAMYTSLLPKWASIGVPVLLYLVFDIFFGLLQAYIFVIISLSYIKGAAEN